MYEVIISNFNRLDAFSKLVEWLKKAEGVLKITIVDNGSTYPPLLEYYETVKDLNIIRGGLSARHAILKEYVNRLDKRKFIVTDSDVVPSENCPLDLILRLDYLLEKYLFAIKVGPKLAIEDIPDHYPFKNDIIRQQQKIQNSIRVCLLSDESCAQDKIVGTKIDTTFAIYRNNFRFPKLTPCISTLSPYVFRHMDWYEDPNNLTPEYQYYLSTINSTSTWGCLMNKHLKGDRS